MLKLSKKVDYGLMSLIHLAHHSEQASWSAREIAENYDIPLELLSKILQRLVQRGLLTSHPGIHGGYSLGRPAEKISAADVIEAIEGPVSLTNCFSDDGMCGQFDKCNLKSPLHRLNDIVLQTFRNLTIEQMSQQQSEDFRSRFMSQDRLISISTLR